MKKENYEDIKQEIIELSTQFKLHVKSGNKQFIRDLHLDAKRQMSGNNLASLRNDYEKKYQHLFLQADRLRVDKISPVLINVESEYKKWNKIFSLVRHTWSMPFSKGYGRRLRYIVFDEFHGSVIGIIGLQSPPADLACRDQLFDYPEKQKLSLVNQTMDIFTLGAVPPYSYILGGKLVAGLAAANVIKKDYFDKYSGKQTTIEKSILDARLVALTTTSAFGRSSIYNRLKFRDHWIAKSIGFTSGSGNIHLEAVYPKIVQLLKDHNKYHGGGYGKGPKQRWQNLARAFAILGLSTDHIDHGLKREVFLYPLVDNLVDGMSGKDFGADLSLDVDEFANYWKSRWAIPRSKRYPDHLSQDTHEYFIKHLN